MQSLRKTVDRKKLDTKDDSIAKKQDDKNKRIDHRVSTPRSFVAKSTADIYSRSTSNVNAPKKAPHAKTTNVSPMKDLLKSSPSSISQLSSRSYRNKPDARVSVSARSTDKNKVPIRTVTNKKPTNAINSPIVKRKLDLGHDKSKEVASKALVHNSKEVSSKKVALPERQRTKTRTLDDEEIKVLTPDVVDNNAELLNLTRQLSAKPKAFYVDLNEEKAEVKTEKSSDEEVSYEDDFESYESDFDSYHSEENGTSAGDDDDDDEASDEQQIDDKDDSVNVQVEDEDANSKEERMLDSGNYELRDPRSANRSKPMDFISEVSEEREGKTKQDSEDSVKVSLTDEGFQDMSSIKTVHVDVLDRPLFIDFTRSKENKRKRRIFEKLQQRAKDILSMVTLHEMSYNLFEMAPIPYDLYMATFGRSNYTQTAVQTFDDGITEEVQTDGIICSNKWTQCPIEFSDNDIYMKENTDKKLTNRDFEEFKFLTDDEKVTVVDDNYKRDPLRIYLEQKDGVGPDTIMPIEEYKSKLKSNSYNVNRLRKFLKKIECRVSNILSVNNGNTYSSNLIKTSKFPFSVGYLSISKSDFDETFLSKSQVMSTVMSETKSNLIITVHRKFVSGFVAQKCVLCLWDLSVARREPLKILISTDNVKIGRFRGSTDGQFVGALEDGSIQLWDLSEEPTWSNDVDDSTKTVEVDSKHLTQTERDREWNLRNSTCVSEEKNKCLLQASSYTSSAMAVCKNETVDSIVGLEFMGDMNTANLGSGRKIIRQICSLQRTGILTIWSIVQEKTNLTNDIGKTFWSKLKLERNQTINLTEYINAPVSEEFTNFNLNAAKKRLTIKRQERNLSKISRPKSANRKIDFDRPKSAASVKNKSVVESNSFCFWENGAVFYHLKVIELRNVDSYLIAKNCGEVLCCRRTLGTVKVKTLRVANEASSVIHLEPSPHGLPYFLAGTDTGTVNLCSLLDYRVLLTLECGSGPVVVDKCIADEKGRYINSVKKTTMDTSATNKLAIKSICWSHSNPFCIIAVCNTNVFVWELTHSDMRAKCTSGDVAHCCSTERALAILTTEGNVQIYKMKDEERNLELFQKYASLL
ncbi:uncharacterized protein LOC124541357 [Vanessa cardui]|uniref:uncharacterized protein LOC124541357 n=1 Tax=Vanessa cardui TaxID=171605 RepID=UPI001F14121B|nr:uncharacterized protein LOC124541357 [Vanessa cardui]